ncbi:tripartite tricarboxylate transporter substrate binding protein [Paucibacter sp. Y2R2-4]|uniref:tripartite tricarboxylate transporter substrate binding protein n=1 Tax=Paucibacter sp. Y2R2-4 TaxID=2893553 RepID=UPI0021E40917|nr:tripartite tricarboxylate transporter substrate binding protein [Paucibacter sp. Y2R2-4]MCV2350677.1 tripartite tricarboxylate transporter substrate binding protein [Paucibacter sp. Y2R2-4]
MSSGSQRRQVLLLPWAALSLPQLTQARASSATSHAEEAWPNWPNRPIRVLLVYPAGGISDLVARSLAATLSARLGQAVLIEHRPGAGGATGIEELARAPADGYTFAFSAITPLSLTPLLRRTHYDPLRDILPVAGVMHTPMLLVATPAFSGRDLAAVLRTARDQPGRLRWASSGMGTTGHLVLEQLQAAEGVRFSHIPYKGGGQQLGDAISGQFELLSTNLGPQQLQYLRKGQLRALAIGAPQRLSSLPEVPSFAELGYPNANLASLFGVFAPAGLSPVLLQRVNHEINLALQHSEMQARLRSIDNLPALGSPADFSRLISQATARNRRLLENGRLMEDD